jgi:hypothetical protein
MKHDKPQIDQNAFSRQLAVYGHEAQGKLMAMKVFIHGLAGVNDLKISLAWKSPKI